jgi:uncharacterized membrane protein YgdD (TMEM256/DUF423 family)
MSSTAPFLLLHRRWLLVAALLGFLAVALGAFAAHGLKPHLDDRAKGWFDLAVRYQMWHTLALLALSFVLNGLGRWFAVAAWGWLVGVLLFCGSLYAMALTGNTGLAWITPLGGTAFLVGWLGLLVGGLRLQ